MAHEGVSYKIGVQRAREKQRQMREQGVRDPEQAKQFLLTVASLRDQMRAEAKDGNLEEALANHLDGYLSVWD